jgi:hypothetical protein
MSSCHKRLALVVMAALLPATSLTAAETTAVDATTDHWQVESSSTTAVPAGTCLTSTWAWAARHFTSTTLRLTFGMRLAVAVQATAERGNALPVAGLMAGAGAIAAINGGYYAQDFRTDGLLRIHGIEQTPISTAAVMSGFIAITSDGMISLRSRGDGPGDAPTVRQCGPFVIDAGGSVGIRMTPDAPLARRSLVAISSGGIVLLIATTDVTLHDLALCLHDAPAGFATAGIDRALNLDGGPSTALVVSGLPTPQVFSERRPVRDCLVVLPPK